VTYKNKTAYDLNLQIRKRLYGSEVRPPCQGDIVILGANSYTLGVLNGEFAVINAAAPVNESRTVHIKDRPPVTLTWRKVELVLTGMDGEERIVTGQLLENYLHGGNKLSPDEMRALYIDFKNRHKDLRPKSMEFKESIRTDEYFNCLKIKYGYAVTCHKAQGGEWDNAFVVWDYSQGLKNQGFYRWAYTAITRTSSTLYNLNPPCFTPYSKMALVDILVQRALDQVTGKTTVDEEVAFDENMDGLLERLGLHNESVPVQDHCLRVLRAINGRGIKLEAWQRLNYEIRYTFRKDAEAVVFKTFVNGNNEFKKPFTILPPREIGDGLDREVAEILAHLPCIRIMRHEALQTTVKAWVEICAVDFEIVFDQDKPFTEALFRDMFSVLSGTGIVIQNIEHISYKERYTFVRGAEVCVLDFSYNGDGFYGKVEVLQKRSNSTEMLSVIKRGLQLIKDGDHVCQ
jgi:hypothetical protein